MQVVEIQAVMLIVYKIQAVVHEANQNNADHMCTWIMHAGSECNVACRVNKMLFVCYFNFYLFLFAY